MDVRVPKKTGGDLSVAARFAFSLPEKLWINEVRKTADIMKE